MYIVISLYMIRCMYIWICISINICMYIYIHIVCMYRCIMIIMMYRCMDICIYVMVRYGMLQHGMACYGSDVM